MYHKKAFMYVNHYYEEKLVIMNPKALFHFSYSQGA